MPFRKKEETEQVEPQSEEAVIETPTPTPAPKTTRRRTPRRRAAAPVVEAPTVRRAAAPVVEAPPAEPAARVKRHRQLSVTRANDRRRG